MQHNLGLRVLVACEFSGKVRDAFASRGHDAWSCDLLPTEAAGKHIQGDVLSVLNDGWDLMIAHPPCTHLAVSGAAFFERKKDLQQQALQFVLALMNAPIQMTAIENPVSVISSRIRQPDQIIQPWWFGDKVQKTTCLWLKNLPPLRPTCVVSSGEKVKLGNGEWDTKWHIDTFKLPAKERGHVRSITFDGIADAMAAQWGCLPSNHIEGFGFWYPSVLKPANTKERIHAT